ncbi:MAG: FtsW/RodA/SpoVE family cell cycle protein, partial [Bacteroidaceae bacterium]|nr:FtsW/RodA/SpoVE family cell cycle protein [Bacteroidaceae bacterium]
MVVDRDSSLFKSLDWFTILLYLLLLAGGWVSVCGASYDFGEVDLLSFDTRSGKQLLWMICSCGLGFVLLMLEERLYETLTNVVYVLMMCLLVVTIAIAPETKGSHSWLILGPVSIQPAEFAKFATALCVARFMNSYGFTMDRWKNFFSAAGIVLLPMVL